MSELFNLKWVLFSDEVPSDFSTVLMCRGKDIYGVARNSPFLGSWIFTVYHAGEGVTNVEIPTKPTDRWMDIGHIDDSTLDFDEEVEVKEEVDDKDKGN